MTPSQLLLVAAILGIRTLASPMAEVGLPSCAIPAATDSSWARHRVPRTQHTLAFPSTYRFVTDGLGLPSATFDSTLRVAELRRRRGGLRIEQSADTTALFLNGQRVRWNRTDLGPEPRFDTAYMCEATIGGRPT